MTRKLELNQSTKYPFDLDKVLYAAQDFRWCKWNDDWHSGVLKGNLIHIRQVNGVLEYKSDSGCDLNELLYRYFRLDVDIDEIYDFISDRDKKVKELVQKYPWLRVLRQPDSWECTVAYICAGYSKIENTIVRVERIAGLGRKLELDDDVRTAFPTWEEVLKAGEDKLREMELRFPKKHPAAIVAAAERIRDGRLNLCWLAEPTVSYAEANRQLMDCYYISSKTANCIALFALDMTIAFPVDRHVWNAVKCHFPLFQHRDEPTDSQKKKIISWAQARSRFGEYAGYANQFLFYWKLVESLRRKGRRPPHERPHPCLGT